MTPQQECLEIVKRTDISDEKKVDLLFDLFLRTASGLRDWAQQVRVKTN